MKFCWFIFTQYDEARLQAMRKDLVDSNPGLEGTGRVLCRDPPLKRNTGEIQLGDGKDSLGVSFGRSSPLDSWLHHCQVCDETEHHDGRELAQQNEAAYLAMAARSRAGGGRDKEREREEGIS